MSGTVSDHTTAGGPAIVLIVFGSVLLLAALAVLLRRWLR